MIKHLLVFFFPLGCGLFGVCAADLNVLRAKADNGDSDAMVELAEAHYWGRGADLNWKQSFFWAEKAAEKNHPVASYRMGVQYLLGQGVEEDINSGQQLIKLSANGMEKRAKDGDHRAQFYLAIMCHTGIGRMDDIPKSRQWMKLAAEGGQVDAQYYMGRTYAMAVGVMRDLVEAKRWWRMAAGQGFVPAQYNLGLVLLNSKNKGEKLEGVKFLKQAVDQKFDRAEFLMGEVAFRGVNMPKDEAAAFRYFEKSANQGYLRAQYLAGQALAKGLGVKSDPVAASVWLTLAARAGHRGAEASLRGLNEELEGKNIPLTGDQLLQIRLQSGEFKMVPSLATQKSRAGLMAADASFLASLSIEELKKHAASGDSIAKVRLAEMYLNGKVIGGQVILRKDLKECLRLNTELATAGHADSQWNLATFYLKGLEQRLTDGTKVDLLEKNPAEAVNWLRKAAAQDYTSAMVILGGLYEKGEEVPLDYKKSMDWFERAASLGDAEACHVIGLAYVNGRGKVVPVDKSKAVEWFLRGADRGDSQAQYDLAGAYLKGEGVRKDLAAARKWLVRAAWQNERRAQLQLSLMLRDGLGGSKDMARAAMWANIAINNRVFEAKQVFDGIRDKLSRDETIRAMELVRKFVPQTEKREVTNSGNGGAKMEARANQGNREAQYQLGLRYLNGTGVKVDRVKACTWLKLAALQGDAEALAEYEDLILKMTNEEIRAADEAADGFKAKQ